MTTLVSIKSLWNINLQRRLFKKMSWMRNATLFNNKTIMECFLIFDLGHTHLPSHSYPYYFQLNLASAFPRCHSHDLLRCHFCARCRCCTQLRRWWWVRALNLLHAALANHIWVLGFCWGRLYRAPPLPEKWGFLL